MSAGLIFEAKSQLIILIDIKLVYILADFIINQFNSVNPVSNFLCIY